MVDSYHDRRTAYEFAVNAAGVKTDRYRFSDAQPGRELGRRVGRDASRATRRAGARSSESRSRSCASTRSAAARSASPSYAACRAAQRDVDVAAAAAGARTGYVSSFGELTGLQLQGSRKRLEVVPYMVGQVADAAGRRRATRFIRSSDATRLLRRRREVRGHAGAHADCHVEPGLRPGRSRPGGREPERVRDVLRRAAAVLRRGVGHLPLRHRLQRRAVPGAVLLAADRPDAARDADRSRRRLLVDPGADDDPRRGEADRPRGQVLGRRAERGDATTSAPASYDGTNTSRTLVEPLTSYSVGRATREFANQSSLGFMATATNRRLTADVSFLPERRLHRRRRLGLAHGQEGYYPGRLLGRQHRARQRRGDRRAADEHGPRLPAPGRRARLTSTRRARR